MRLQTFPTKKSKKKPATVKIAMWSARHSWPVFILWFVMVFGLAAAMAGLGTKTEGWVSTSLPSTEAGKANQVFKDAGGVLPDNLIVVFNHPTLKVGDPAYQAVVSDTAKRL